MKPIIEESDILQRIKDEKLDVWICGPGGCASNLLSHYLEEHHSLNTRTKAWHQLLGHFYKPLPCDIPKIFIYNDPVYTFCSLHRRGPGFWGTNQYKLANDEHIKPSNDYLFQLIFTQFKNWTENAHQDNKLLVIHTDELFTQSGQDKLEKFLKIKIENFPKKREKHDYTDFHRMYHLVIQRYQKNTNHINNYLK